MRMVKICMLILCAVVLFAPQTAQSEQMPMPNGMMMMPGGMLVPAPSMMQQGDAMMMHGGMPMQMQHKDGMMMQRDMTRPNMMHDGMMMQQNGMRPTMMMQPGMKPPPPPPMHKDGMRPMPPMPQHYTSPNGVMKHYSPEMQMMMNRRQMMMRPNMMMNKGMMKKGCCGGMKMDCPKMRNMQMQGMNPEMMRMRKMMNKPGMMNQNMMIKHDKMMMKQGMMRQEGSMMEPNMMMRPDMMQKGMMQHDMMHQGMMHKNMMMQKGVPFDNQMKRMPMMAGGCPMCAKVQSANMNPAMRTELMRTLTEFSMQNKPMYDELMMLRQQTMMMHRSALKSPANRSTLELKREKVRKALMGNLTRQRMVLKDRFGLDITGRDLLMHRIHEMQMMNPGGVMMMNGTMMPMQNMQHGMMPMQSMQHGMMNGYRSPQQMNPHYNQNYLRNAPMREGYTGETYQ